MAAAWTAIAVLGGGLLGSLFYLGNRIDALGARLDGRIDSLSSRLEGRLDAMTAEIRDLRGELGGRIDALSARMDDHLGRHAG